MVKVENVCSDQSSLGFRVGHRHVQLTSVDLYIKLQEMKRKKGELEKKEKAKSYLHLRYESNIESEDERQPSTTCL